MLICLKFVIEIENCNNYIFRDVIIVLMNGTSVFIYNTVECPFVYNVNCTMSFQFRLYNDISAARDLRNTCNEHR